MLNRSKRFKPVINYIPQPKIFDVSGNLLDFEPPLLSQDFTDYNMVNIQKVGLSLSYMPSTISRPFDVVDNNLLAVANVLNENIVVSEK